METPTVVDLVPPFQCDIRIDHATKQASVIDTVKSFTGFPAKHAQQAFHRLGEDYVARCPTIRINGAGKLTPVAPASVLVEIIWALPHKAAKEFRRKSAIAICRLLGADQSLIQEIEVRGATTPSSRQGIFRAARRHCSQHAYDFWPSLRSASRA